MTVYQKPCLLDRTFGPDHPFKKIRERKKRKILCNNQRLNSTRVKSPKDKWVLRSYLKKRRENGLTSSERKDTGHSYVWLFLTFVAALYSHFSLSPLMFIQENRSHTLGRPSLSWTNNRKMCYEVYVYEYEWNAPTFKWQSQTLILWTET